MPLTELVVLISAAIAYLTGLAFWFAHCREARRAVQASGLRRLTSEPATALVGGLPLLAAIWFVVVWRILPFWL
jgi:hypothetical protein